MHRIGSILLITVLLFSVFAAGRRTTHAHEATPAAATVSHPIAGAWEVTTTAPDLIRFPLAVFTADGAFHQVEYVEEGETRSPIGIGTWEATGDQSVDVLYYVFENADGTHVMAWSTIEVSPGGRTFLGTTFREIMAADGSVSEQSEYTIIGTRLAVEPRPPLTVPAATPAG